MSGHPSMDDLRAAGATPLVAANLAPHIAAVESAVKRAIETDLLVVRLLAVTPADRFDVAWGEVERRRDLFDGGRMDPHRAAIASVTEDIAAGRWEP